VSDVLTVDDCTKYYGNISHCKVSTHCKITTSYHWHGKQTSTIVITIIVPSFVVVLAAAVGVATTVRATRSVRHMRHIASLSGPASCALTITWNMCTVILWQLATGSVSTARAVWVAVCLAVDTIEIQAASALVFRRCYLALQLAAMPSVARRAADATVLAWHRAACCFNCAVCLDCCLALASEFVVLRKLRARIVTSMCTAA
jgi:hypothetical protein